MYIAERMFLRGHKNHFWILCNGIYTKDLGYDIDVKFKRIKLNTR